MNNKEELAAALAQHMAEVILGRRHPDAPFCVGTSQYGWWEVARCEEAAEGGPAITVLGSTASPVSGEAVELEVRFPLLGASPEGAIPAILTRVARLLTLLEGGALEHPADDEDEPIRISAAERLDNEERHALFGVPPPPIPK